MVQLQMTFFCNILQHYQLLFVDFTWMVSALLCHEYIHSDSVICLPSFVWWSSLVCVEMGVAEQGSSDTVIYACRKPSPAASQYFRTWSQKFSTQISGDCTPALGYCFWWLISWDWQNYLLGTSRFVDGLLNVSKGIKQRELWDWSGSVVETTYALSELHGMSYIWWESHQKDLQTMVLFLGVA